MKVGQATDPGFRRLDAIRRIMPLVVALGTLLIGGYFMVSTAPGHIPDIWAHVYRIVSITNGDIVARPVDSKSYLHGTTGNVGGYVDWEWIDYSQRYFDGYDPAVVLTDTITVQDASGADVPCNNAAINFPVAYLPQLIGFLIGKWCGFSPDVTYYLAESLMLLTYAGCMAIAVWSLRKWRILIGLTMLCPLLLVRSSFAISADSFTQALAFLLSCMVFATLYRRVSLRYCVACGVVSVMLAMCKFTYMPLILLTLVIPWLQQGLRGHVDGRLADADGSSPAVVSTPVRTSWWRSPSFAVLAVCDAVAVVWVAVWMRATGWFVTTPMIVSFEEMTERKHSLLTDPGTMISAVRSIVTAVVTAKANLDRPLDSMLIRSCWILMTAMLVVLVVACAMRVLDKYRIVLLWGSTVLIFGIILLTYVAFWLQYTPTGATVVDGMQHRYFLPLGVLGMLVAAESIRAIIGRLPIHYV